MSLTIPGDPLPVAGVWSREWEEDPLGCNEESVDRSTLVLWTQSLHSGIYVDLRLPKSSPGRCEHARTILEPRPSALAANGYSKEAVEQLRAPQYLDVLLRTKSFAGVLSYSQGDTTDSSMALRKDALLADLVGQGTSNDAKPPLIPLCTCFWRRDLDYQPPSGSLDIGVCVSESSRRADGSLLMRETGDDGSYAEGWARSCDTEQGPFMALELLSENGVEGTRKGYWVRAGKRFAYAVGRPLSREAANILGCLKTSCIIQQSVGKSLQQVISEYGLNDSQVLDSLGSYICVVGEIDAGGEWVIQHSTHPELVGCLLVGSKQNKLCCSVLGDLKENPSDRSTVNQAILCSDSLHLLTRTWSVVELVGCDLPI